MQNLLKQKYFSMPRGDEGRPRTLESRQSKFPNTTEAHISMPLLWTQLSIDLKKSPACCPAVPRSVQSHRSVWLGEGICTVSWFAHTASLNVVCVFTQTFWSRCPISAWFISCANLILFPNLTWRCWRAVLSCRRTTVRWMKWYYNVMIYSTFPSNYYCMARIQRDFEEHDGWSGWGFAFKKSMCLLCWIFFFLVRTGSRPALQRCGGFGWRETITHKWVEMFYVCCMKCDALQSGV